MKNNVRNKKKLESGFWGQCKHSSKVSLQAIVQQQHTEIAFIISLNKIRIFRKPLNHTNTPIIRNRKETSFITGHIRDWKEQESVFI